jgi:hypothetical protein
MQPVYGITSTPVIDLGLGFIIACGLVYNNGAVVYVLKAMRLSGVAFIVA